MDTDAFSATFLILPDDTDEDGMVCPELGYFFAALGQIVPKEHQERVTFKECLKVKQYRLRVNV